MKFSCDGTIESCLKCPLDDCRLSEKDKENHVVHLYMRDHENKRREHILKYATAEKLAYAECGKPARRLKYDRDRIIRLWEDGWTTQQEIAELCKCSIATVRKVLVEDGFQQVFEIQGEVWKKIQRFRT